MHQWTKNIVRGAQHSMQVRESLRGWISSIWVSGRQSPSKYQPHWRIFFKPSIDNCLYFFMGQLSNDYNCMTKSLPYWNKRLRCICMNWRIRDWEQLVLSLKVIETTTKIHSMHVGQEIEKITRVRDWEDNSKNKLY